MSVQSKARMNVEEFLAWAEHQPGRYELVDGEVFGMPPQRARHTRTKYRVQNALDRAIAEAGLPCEMLGDGLTVQVDPQTAYEPDALVQCGEAIADDAIVATLPIIVVEILPPGTGHVDTGQKLAGYFSVLSVMHCLIVDPKKTLVIHHRRGEGEMIETHIATSGIMELHPPGLSLSVADFFAAS